MGHTKVKILLLLYCFTLRLQGSMSTEFRRVRYRSSYAGYLQKHDRTAMDMITDVTDQEAVKLEDGVKLRDGDIAVSSSSSAKKCFARSCLWSKSVDGHVYIAYTLAPQYTEAERGSVSGGMRLIERHTCVRFVPRTHQRDFLDIQPKTGCWSYVGVSGGRQVVSLSPQCLSSGVVSHQLMHALGFVHEHSRADRDNYITILWHNIWKDRVRNFEKFKMNNMDMPYDYGSIMHFGRYAYSENGDATIVPKQSWNLKLGQTFGPSELDLMKINKLYECF